MSTIKDSANTLRRGYGPGYPTPHWAKKAPTTIDCTPSPAAMLRMLLTIIEGSSDDESRDYARSEIERCYPDPVTCVQDVRYEPPRVFSGTKDQCSAYAANVANDDGAGHCDIYVLQNYAHAMDFFDMIFIPTLESK